MKQRNNKILRCFFLFLTSSISSISMHLIKPAHSELFYEIQTINICNDSYDYGATIFVFKGTVVSYTRTADFVLNLNKKPPEQGMSCRSFTGTPGDSYTISVQYPYPIKRQEKTFQVSDQDNYIYINNVQKDNRLDI